MSLILALALQAAPAVQWEIVFDGPAGILSVDPASIRRTGDIVTMRRRTEFRVTSADGMRSLVLNVTMSCRARTYIVERIEGYREDGSLIRAVDFPPERAAASVFPLASDAEADAIYRAGCGSAAA